MPAAGAAILLASAPVLIGFVIPFAYLADAAFDRVQLNGLPSSIFAALRSTVVFAAGATEADHDWLSSARARLGYAFGDALVYGTAGIGYGGLSVASIAPGLTERISTTQFGYVVGAGVEMKFTAMISGRLEALHYGFGQKDFAFSGGSGRVDADVTTVRAGLSLHLN